MYSNFPAQGNVCDSGVLKTNISDHYAIFCIANNAVVNNPYENKWHKKLT